MMTMRRFMWIFVVIGLASLLLAAAGHWLLQWGRDGVHTWLCLLYTSDAADE